ncbi:hypothetical protein CP10881SC42_0893 [Chlamydia avium]|uniref:Uncharacterized protein n=1 Tax=Chlamydia avium TaxID=1457141 RepID=A0ABN0MS51_9CHLA|nr:hypothetical protein CP10881SC42_0893 [Chlamydia avium]
MVNRVIPIFDRNLYIRLKRKAPSKKYRKSFLQIRCGGSLIKGNLKRDCEGNEKVI